jgi:hypothetical protein
MSDQVSSYAISFALETTFKLLSDYFFSVAKFQLDKHKIESRLPYLNERVNNIRQVKTLWQLDKPVDVESFYCESHLLFPITFGKEPKRVVVDDISQIPSRRVLIKGIAGQGKSIFLRHLCIREFQKGGKVPIFIELRRIQKTESLKEHVIRYFSFLDVNITDELYSLMSKSGTFVFFLDAFDEVLEESKPYLLNEIEELAVNSKASFIVTSRSHTAIEMSNYFDVYTLDNLIDDEYKVVIKQLLSDRTQYADTLMKSIAHSKSDISSLLCTPLLITLLIISYQSYQSFPDQLTDFYESIFLVLLQRHDGTKPGYSRKRRCSINDNQYRRIFDSFCFHSKQTRLTYFDYQKVYDLILKAIADIGLTVDTDDFLKDIRLVTCLLLEEGNQFHFIHKSVQEYYAASFIRSLPDTAAQRYYNTCLEPKKYVNWLQELDFLSEIDKFRFTKYYLIPRCVSFLAKENPESLLIGVPPISYEFMHAIFDGLVARFYPDGRMHLLRRNPGLTKFMFTESNFPSKLFQIDYSDLVKSLPADAFIERSDLIRQTSQIKNKPSVELDLNVLVDQTLINDKLKTAASHYVQYVYNIWKTSREYVLKEESLVVDF